MNSPSKHGFLRLAFLLLGVASLVFAHGHDEGERMEMSEGSMGQAEASNSSNPTDTGPPSYFRHAEYSGLILAHVIIMSVGWIFVLPLGMPKHGSFCHFP